MTEPTPVTITLKRPIEYKEKSYPTVTFSREVLGRDLLAMDSQDGPTKKEWALLASMAGVPLPIFYDMPVKDIGKVRAGASVFMGESGPTAEVTPAD